MMTVIDVEEKIRGLKVCERLAENNHIHSIKDYHKKLDSPYIRVYAKGGRENEEKLLKLFLDNGFNAKQWRKDNYILLIFEKEVENESMEDCFNI